LRTILALVLSAAFTHAAWAQPADWQKQWNDTLAAAKKEGKVVVVGSPDPVMRNDLIPKFTKQFGIQVEYLTGSSSALAGRIQTERQSGIYSIDVYLSGAGTTVSTLYPQKMLDPLKPLLIHPDVADPKKWKRDGATFMDPEGQYIMMLFSTVNDTLFINTDFVKPEELKSVQDLINPRWKGKIASQDPRLGGSGANTAVAFYVGLGPEYIKKLYVDQQPVYSRDRRQLTDWLARGTYPICLTCRADDIKPLLKDGFKLVDVFDLDGIMSRVNSAPLLMAYANKAPHPNAAKVFINWFAGKDALETYSREYEAVTLRTDVDESFLDPRMIPKPGVKYPDDTEFEWVLKGRNETADKVRDLLK
jgi:iron(III) transport system substrate-binding protein